MTRKINTMLLRNGLINSQNELPSFEPEASAFFLAAGDFSNGERYAYNRWFSRMKTAGLLGKVSDCWMLASPDGRRYTSLINPSKKIAIVGYPVVEPEVGVMARGASYFDTGIVASTLAHEDCHIAVMSETASTNASVCFGCSDGSGNGLSISPYAAKIRVASAEVTAGSGSTANGAGFTFATRNNSETLRVDRNGQLVGVVSSPSVALPSANLFVGLENQNGSPGSVSDKLVSFVSVGAYMTQEESQLFYAITRSLYLAIHDGAPDFKDAGKSPSAVSAEFVSYGLTPAGITAAYEAKRQGLKAVIVGGWHDRHLGGMLSGGLGATDWFTFTGLGGLARWFLEEIRRISGWTKNTGNVTTWDFEPAQAEAMFRRMLDPRRENGLDIPVYFSDGVQSVTKEGSRITSFTTVDGRTFSGAYFHDGSYEGDLMALSGVEYVIGREASGTNYESLNGRTILSSLYDIDPYVTPGDSGSGLIYGVTGDDGQPQGSADISTYRNKSVVSAGAYTPKTQAFNFRVDMTQTALRKVDLPSVAPVGYDSTKHEILLRVFAARTLLGTPLLFAGGDGTNPVFSKQGEIGPQTYDMNSNSGASTDHVGANWTYPEASYTDRAAIRSDHVRNILGIIHLCQYGVDSRIPAAVKSDALSYGLLNDHFLDPHEDSPLFFPYQMYVREGRRMVGSVVLDGNDVFALPEVTPPSIKTVATASYSIDSHVVQYVVSSGKVVKEGGFFNTFTESPGGHVSPLPLEIIVPKKIDCENLGVTFCISATHAANGSIRMEMSSMQMAQSYAHVVKTAIDSGSVAVQDVDYATLRESILSSNANRGEPQPVLPQEN